MRSNRSTVGPPRQPPRPTHAADPGDHGHVGDDQTYAASRKAARSSLLLPLAITVILTALVVSAAYAVLVVLDLRPERLIAVALGTSRPASSGPTVQSAAPPIAPTQPPPTVRPVGQAIAATTPRDRFTHAFSLWRDITYSITAADPDQPQPFQQIRQMSGDLQYLDGSAFQTENTLVRLSGIASLPREAVCVADNKTKFACGLQARASLSLLVSPERPRCYPDVSLATSEPAWVCTARGKLLSAAQIEAGFALPSQPSIERYVVLAQQARDAHAGAWNGDWTLVPATSAQP